MLFESVRFLDGVAYPQIADRKYVEAAQREDQEHVDRPNADPLHLGEPLNHLRVTQFRQVFKDQLAVACMARQIAYIGRLLLR
jgi:hypothetical protein